MFGFFFEGVFESGEGADEDEKVGKRERGKGVLVMYINTYSRNE